MFRVLLIDDEFKSLDIPLTTDQYVTLEYQIRKGLYREPVLVWNDYIIEGFQRYNLYQKYHTFYRVIPEFLSNRYLAVAWSCRKQLTRTDLTANAEAWLLYRLYNTEQKIEQKKRAKDTFQYKQLSPSTHSVPNLIRQVREDTAVLERISAEYKISSATLKRYNAYGKSLDQLERIFPGVRNRILTGDLEVARTRVPDLLRMPRQDLRAMIENPRCHRLDPPITEKREHTASKRGRRSNSIKLNTGIKEMPAYDPDAELNGLVFTIGAWKSAVSRAIEKSDFDKATITGRVKLQDALSGLLTEINKLNDLVEVNNRD